MNWKSAGIVGLFGLGCAAILGAAMLFALRFEAQPLRGGFIRVDRLTGQVVACSLSGGCEEILSPKWTAAAAVAERDYFKGLE